VVPTAGLDILEKIKYPALLRIKIPLLDHPAHISVTVPPTSYTSFIVPSKYSAGSQNKHAFEAVVEGKQLSSARFQASAAK
jgi:hypothetical protein